MTQMSSQAVALRQLVAKMKGRKGLNLDNFVVIGVDFGTTYSGASWATLADFENNQINLITAWPGTGKEESKAPTELVYKDNQVLWGYSIPADAEPFQWFKLLLLREADLAPELRRSEMLIRSRKLLAESNKTATDLIADYLKALWTHVLRTIHRARSRSVIDALAFHVVITVPAIWPDYARAAMTTAVRMAGILDARAAGTTTFAFAPEPEAAALATLWERSAEIKKGEVYMICDAGGGTVDLISYRVSNLYPVELHEAVVGTGGLCGGVFIDEYFQAMCKSRLGRRWHNLTQNGIKEIMKHEWEYAVKPQFTPDDPSMEYIVAVPAEAFTGTGVPGLTDDSVHPPIKNGRIHFASSHIQAAFDGAFHDIHTLTKSQVSEARKHGLRVKGIILVGGLGSSAYLYQYLEQKFFHEGIEILQSTGIRPRTAICRGAIYKGFLETLASRGHSADSQVPRPFAVASTMVRKSLGVDMMEDFNVNIHLVQDKVWDDLEGKWLATNQMTWLLRKGTNVVKTKPKSLNFLRKFVEAKEFADGPPTVTIYECSDNSPPSRLIESVKFLCRIRVNPNVAFHSLPEVVGQTGRKYRAWNYVVEMVPSGASTEFTVYHKGIQVGSQNVALEFE